MSAGSRVLFIENRDKTNFWAAVGKELAAAGAQISFLVQNRIFAPRGPFRCHFLKAPQKSDMSALGQGFALLDTDRGPRFFEAGTGHYGGYAAQIEQAIDAIGPDVVVGEATLFHELIALEICRARGIRYVQPSGNRYPQGRFSLFLYDHQICAVRSGDTWPDEQLADAAARIAEGREIPFYMLKDKGLDRVKQRGTWFAARFRVFAGRFSGEVYNTPSLRRKARLQRDLVHAKRRWPALVARAAEPSLRYILYPMQLQPEANIDVWGRPWSDQTALVERLLAAAPEDVGIAVKANPKTKYEILTGMLDLAEREPRVRLLPMDLPMVEAHRQAVGAVTVTGTVGLEAIFGRGRCLSLRHPIIEEAFPEFHATSPEDAVEALLNNTGRGCGSVERGIDLLRLLIDRSFPGMVSDPVSHPQVMDPANVRGVAAALHRCLEQGRA